MTPEEPLPNKPKNPPGRPKMPDYTGMHPVYELYFRVRNRLRKTKPVTAPEIKGWLIEIGLLRAQGFTIRVNEPEAPTPESLLQTLTSGSSEAPTQIEKPKTDAVQEISFGDNL